MINQTKYNASALPALATCSGFRSKSHGHGPNYALDGIERHNTLEDMFRTFDGILPSCVKETYDLQSVEGIEWAYERIMFHAELAQYALEIETPVTVINEETPDPERDPLWTEIKARIDYRCGDTFFDFKWRRRDYTAQMAVYALGLMQLRNVSKVDCWLLFGESKTEEKLTFTKAKALYHINSAIAEASGSSKLNPSPYCNWCAMHTTCKAVLTNVNKIAEREAPELEKLESHFQTDPDARSRALRIGAIAARWNKAYKDRATLHAMNGLDFPGFKLVAKRGELKIDNIAAAFAHSGLDEDEFISCCSASFSSIAEARARKHAIPLATSKRELKRLLAGYLKESETTYYLEEEKTK